MSFLVRFVGGVDALNEYVGRGVAWLTLAMVLITFSVVIMRYVFSFGFVWLQESYVWLHGIVFMAGAGYTLLHGGHVRVDIFYRPADARRKAWVDLIGAFVLMLPMILLVFFVSYDYVLKSWAIGEGSREAGGLPGLFLLKSFLWVFCILVGLQCLSMAGRAVLVLAGHPGFVENYDGKGRD